jgi:two-component system, OmpR family, response regulator
VCFVAPKEIEVHVHEILIVDDERHIRELLARWIGDEDFAISESANAEHALSLMSERPIAVVLIDKDMPGHDGTWLIEQIQKRHPGVAMLLATGDPAVAPRVSMSTGVLDYLVKPFTREMVVAAVKDAVRWHEAAAQRPHEGAADSIDTWLQQGGADRPRKSDSQTD